jgi:hypothetical protein
MHVRISRTYLIFLGGVRLLAIFYENLKAVTGGGVRWVVVGRG